MGIYGGKMKKEIYVWEPYFFMVFGLFHLHRIWGLIDRKSYATFWLGLMESKGVIYFGSMFLLASLCVLGIITFYKNKGRNFWWRWIYILGGSYVLFDLFAIAVGMDFWHKLIVTMYDVTSPYWNVLWSGFILLGGFIFTLGIKLLAQRKR